LHKGGTVESVRLNRMGTMQLARYTIAALTPSAVAEYRDARLREVTPGTVLRELQLLSAVINHARKEWNFPVDNAVSRIRMPQPNRARARQMDVDEEGRLLEALEPLPRDTRGRFKGGRNPWIKPIVQVALETAMRRSELLSLRWENLHLERRVAILRDTKNGDSRQVPLSTRAVELLQVLPRSIDGRVFPMSANALKLSFNRALRRAGIANFHFHDLRHEATGRLAVCLPNVIELAAVTGHRDLRMLARYYHPRPEDLAKKLG
jgi:integrase